MNKADQRRHPGARERLGLAGHGSTRRAAASVAKWRRPGTYVIPGSAAELARAPSTAGGITQVLPLQPAGRLRAPAERRPRGGHRLGRSRAAAQQAGTTTPRVPWERLRGSNQRAAAGARQAAEPASGRRRQALSDTPGPKAQGPRPSDEMASRRQRRGHVAEEQAILVNRSSDVCTLCND